MSVDWAYFDKFSDLTDKYLPPKGEGNTMATQIVTAVCKLVYKWYNDGDVFDNTYELSGWCNDLSSYANWLDIYTEDAGEILSLIKTIKFDCDAQYEELLKKLADKLLNAEYLAEQDKMECVGSVYSCDGQFRFDDEQEEDEEDWWEEDEDDELEDEEF